MGKKRVNSKKVAAVSRAWDTDSSSSLLSQRIVLDDAIDELSSELELLSSPSRSDSSAQTPEVREVNLCPITPSESDSPAGSSPEILEVNRRPRSRFSLVLGRFMSVPKKTGKWVPASTFASRINPHGNNDTVERVEGSRKNEKGKLLPGILKKSSNSNATDTSPKRVSFGSKLIKRHLEGFRSVMKPLKPDRTYSKIKTPKSFKKPLENDYTRSNTTINPVKVTEFSKSEPSPLPSPLLSLLSTPQRNDPEWLLFKDPIDDSKKVKTRPKSRKQKKTDVVEVEEAAVAPIKLPKKPASSSSKKRGSSSAVADDKPKRRRRAARDPADIYDILSSSSSSPIAPFAFRSRPQVKLPNAGGSPAAARGKRRGYKKHIDEGYSPK